MTNETRTEESQTAMSTYNVYRCRNKGADHVLVAKVQADSEKAAVATYIAANSWAKRDRLFAAAADTGTAK